jgi:MoxR-like ATPase
MASKPGGFGFNAVMSELDQLAGRHSHYPLFERSVFDQHRAEKDAASTALATAASQMSYDAHGGLDLRPSDPDRYDDVEMAPQRRDYWPAQELQALREARAELMRDPFAPMDSDHSEWGTSTWDAVSGWLAMQGYNRSGPECTAASAADDAAALAPASTPGVSGSGNAQQSKAADVGDGQAQSAQDLKIAEQAALLKRHSAETLRLVDKSAAGGRLRPILSEADVAMATELQDSAAAAAACAAASAMAAATAQTAAATAKLRSASSEREFSESDRINDTQSSLAARVEVVVNELVRRSGLLERDSEARVLLLAALASQHVLLFGPPGTGKTTLCRQVASVFVADADHSKPAQLFERLVTRFSVPEELLGPFSLSALREDTHIRLSDGYLGTAEWAFLDEIFQASSSLLNSLLELLADRIIAEGGGSTPFRAPLVCMMGTAGALPDEAHPGGELAALFDRFLLRVTLRPMSIAGKMQSIQMNSPEALQVAMSMHTPESIETRSVAGGSVVDTPGATVEQTAAAATTAFFSVSEGTTIRGDSKSVALPDSVMTILQDVAHSEATRSVGQEAMASGPDSRSEPAAMGYISDRRLVACASLLRLIAYTSGRDAVHPLDCLLLRHCLPHHDADNPGAADRVTDQIVSYCAVPASALKDLRQGTELQKCILRHLVHSTASKRSPAHGSSRDWRQRPVGVLAAAVGPSPANSASDLDSSGQGPTSPVPPGERCRQEILSDMQTQIEPLIQRMAMTTSKLRIACEEAHTVLLCHPWLSVLERTQLSRQLKDFVQAHAAEAHQLSAELLALELWLAKGIAAQDEDPVGPALLSLMPGATASLLHDLLAPTSSPDEQRSALRLVQAGGFHASMVSGGSAPKIKTYTNLKQRGAIEMWAEPAHSGGGMP